MSHSCLLTFRQRNLVMSTPIGFAEALSPFERFRVRDNVPGPKRTRHPPDVIWPIITPTRMLFLASVPERMFPGPGSRSH